MSLLLLLLLLLVVVVVVPRLVGECMRRRQECVLLPMLMTRYAAGICTTVAPVAHLLWRACSIHVQ